MTTYTDLMNGPVAKAISSQLVQTGKDAINGTSPISRGEATGIFLGAAAVCFIFFACYKCLCHIIDKPRTTSHLPTSQPRERVQLPAPAAPTTYQTEPYVELHPMMQPD